MLKAVVEDYNVYEMTESLPMVFVVTQAELAKGGEAGELLRQDVTPVLPAFLLARPPGRDRRGARRRRTGGADQPTTQAGRCAWMGRRVEMKNVGGYLAVELPPGRTSSSSFSRAPSSGVCSQPGGTGRHRLLLVRDLPLNRQRWQALLPPGGRD